MRSTHNIASIFDNTTTTITYYYYYYYYLRLWDTNRSPNLDQKTRPSVDLHEELNKLSSGFCYFNVPQNENEKLAKYLDVNKEVKKPRSMTVTVMLTAIAALGIVFKDFDKSQDSSHPEHIVKIG